MKKFSDKKQSKQKKTESKLSKIYDEMKSSLFKKHIEEILNFDQSCTTKYEKVLFIFLLPIYTNSVKILA